MYDFMTRLDRSHTGSVKWDRRNDAEKADNLIPLSIADMEFRSAPSLIEALKEAADFGVFGYTGMDDAYVSAVKGFMRRRHSADIDAENIIPMPGVVYALNAAIRAYTRESDGVIIQPPVYPPFYSSVTNNNRRLLLNPLLNNEGRYTMDFDGLKKLAKEENARMLVLCSPHNPVGRVWTIEELRELYDICSSYGIFVVSDEIHSDLILEGKHTFFMNVDPGTKDMAIVLNAPSKTFNVPGLMASNTFVFNSELHKALSRQMETDGLSGVNCLGSVAIRAAYDHCDDWLDEVLEVIRNNRDCLRDFLRKNMPEIIMSPMEGTYLAWLDMRPWGMDAKELEDFTRNKARLLLDEGYIFGESGKGFERVNLALPLSELNEALDRLLKAYSSSNIPV